MDKNNAKYKNLYVLGDSLSDNGACVGILKHLSFAESLNFVIHLLIKGGPLVMVKLL